MANAGRVELNVVAVGEDQLSAMLAKLDVQANKTAETVKRTAAAATAASAGMGSMGDKVKGAIAPVDKLRSSFNAVMENVSFLTVGVGGLVMGLGSLISSIESPAYKEWVASSRALPETFEKVRDLIREVDVLLGTRSPLTEWEKASRAIGEQFDKLATELDKALAAEREQRTAINSLLAFYSSESQVVVSANNDLARIQDTIKSIEVERLRLQERQTDLVKQQRIDLAAIAAGQSASLAADALRAQLDAAGPRPRSAPRPSGSGGGGRSAPDPMAGWDPRLLDSFSPPSEERRERSRSFGALISEIVAEIDAEEEALRRGIEAQRLFGDELDKLVDRGAWSTLKDDIDASNESLLSFLGTIEQAANAAFPELGAGLQELATITEDYSKRVEAIEKQRADGTLSLADAQTKASEETTMAIIGGSTAVLAGLAKELGGLREFYLVKAAGEIAAGVATQFTNPAESASHFTAAALYGVAAARAGGGGGGGGGGSARGGGGGSTNQGRPGRVQEREGGAVINISTLVTDRATVRRTVGAVMARRDRSGYSRWEGT